MFLTDDMQRFCTGAIVNNVEQDGRQLFLTAHHCIFRPEMDNSILAFNYQQARCFSGGSFGAAPNAEPPMQTVQGIRLLAAYKDSDVALYEVLEAIPDAYNVYYAGWSRKQELPRSVVGIHHPKGDVKKISKASKPVTLTSWSEAPRRLHLEVPQWDVGITEAGSSGSPLFNSRGRIVGQLHGGTSACNNPQGFDSYGFLPFSWAGTNRSMNQQLAPFLDPQGRKALAMDGAYFKTSKATVGTLQEKVPLVIAAVEYAKEAASRTPRISLSAVDLKPKLNAFGKKVLDLD